MRELRLHPDAALAAGRHRPLFVQRLRPLQQDERPQPAPHQAAEARGECERRLRLRPGPERRSCCGPGAAGLSLGVPAGTGAARPAGATSAQARGHTCPLHTLELLSAGCPETSVGERKIAFPSHLHPGHDVYKCAGGRCGELPF